MGKGDNPVFILVVVLVLVVYGFWTMSNNPAPSPDTNQVDSIVDTNNGRVNTVASINYTQALIEYKDARIQLDQDCRATPTNVTYKNNTNIMIDNRASVSRTVKVGSVFTIGAYGFKIVKLTSASLPVTWYVDCDTSQNVATILIQK